MLGDIFFCPVHYFPPDLRSTTTSERESSSPHTVLSSGSPTEEESTNLGNNRDSNETLQILLYILFQILFLHFRYSAFFLEITPLFRLKQLLHWCGDDFDGCIIFDECHKAKNLCPTGAGKPTKTGMTVLELQNKLPKARVVYASATGSRGKTLKVSFCLYY